MPCQCRYIEETDQQGFTWKCRVAQDYPSLCPNCEQKCEETLGLPGEYKRLEMLLEKIHSVSCV